jgi:hypothetical protein
MAHKILGYLEEEGVASYSQFLEEIDAGKVENVPEPRIAKACWGLPDDARLRDVVIVVRADEAENRDAYDGFSGKIAAGDQTLGAASTDCRTERRRAAIFSVCAPDVFLYTPAPELT